MDSFVLLSLPLFILAGALMETGGIAHRLVRLAVALVGWVRGGLGMAVVAAEYIFSGISGSTVADVSAVAATTIPGMVRAGYSKELAVAVVSAASAMGILVPPCILMIVIGSVDEPLGRRPLHRRLPARDRDGARAHGLHLAHRRPHRHRGRAAADACASSSPHSARPSSRSACPRSSSAASWAAS